VARAGDGTAARRPLRHLARDCHRGCVAACVFPRDPADRIIVATALVLGATLLTSDARIIDAELVPALS